jgi:hypothetical protein
MNESLAKNEYPEELINEYKKSDKCSLVAKTMTKELWDKYCNV